MVDVLKFNQTIVHPDAIREVFVEEGTTKVYLITDEAIHTKEFDSEHEANAAVEKISVYLNIIEEI